MPTNSYDIEIKKAGDNSYSSLRSVFHVYLLKGTYEKLLEPLARKDFIKNENRLNHGVQYFTETRTLKYKSRELSLRFYLEAERQITFLERLRTFINFISDGVIMLRVPRLDTIFKIVYSDCTAFNESRLKGSTFTVKFIEPNPTDRMTLAEGDAEITGNGSEDSPPENPDTDSEA